MDNNDGQIIHVNKDDPGNTSGCEYDVYIPAGVDASTPVHLYIPGSGGSKNDTAPLKNYLENDSNSIVIMPNWGSGESGSNNVSTQILTICDSVIDTYGGNSENVSVTGFSLGCARSVYTAYLSNSGDYNTKINTFVTIDGSDAINSDYIQTFKENDVLFVSLSSYNYPSSDFKAYAAAGGSVLFVKPLETRHVAINSNAYANGLIDFLNGTGDLNLGDSNRPNYTFQTYVNGELVTISYEEAKKLVEEHLALVSSGAIGSIGSISIDTVQSDVPTLQAYMDAIHRKIESSNFFTFSANGLQSNTKIPVSEQAVTLQFYRACAALLGKLVNDTNYILTLGSKINEMDENLMKRIDAIAPPVEAEEVPEVTGSNTSTATTSERSTSENVLAGMGTGATIGAAIGATIGTIIEPGVGTVLLGAAGAAIGTLVGAGIALWRQFISGKDTYFFGSNPGSSDTTSTETTTETTGNGGR